MSKTHPKIVLSGYVSYWIVNDCVLFYRTVNNKKVTHVYHGTVADCAIAKCKVIKGCTLLIITPKFNGLKNLLGQDHWRTIDKQ